MLHLIVWVAIYFVLLFGLGKVLGEWRTKRWFKFAFFPGTVLAAALQSLSSFLCFATWGRFRLLSNDCPAFEINTGRMAYVPGGCFLLITHGLLYCVFAYFTPIFHYQGAIDAHFFTLPNLYPLEILEGRIAIDVSSSFGSIRGWLGAFEAQPILATLYLYGAISIFASLAVSGRVWRYGTLVLFAVGCGCYIAGWFGAGLTFMGRGWWASYLHFPRWWGLFSFFVFLCGFSLATFSLARFLPQIRSLIWGAVTAPISDEETRKNRKARRKSARADRRRARRAHA